MARGQRQTRHSRGLTVAVRGSWTAALLIAFAGCATRRRRGGDEADIFGTPAHRLRGLAVTRVANCRWPRNKRCERPRKGYEQHGRRRDLRIFFETTGGRDDGDWRGSQTA